MRITGKIVRHAAEWAERVTEGAFKGVQIGGDIGYGARYIDGVRMKVWLGRTGAREAAAYYLSAGVWWQNKTGRDLPDWVAETLPLLTAEAQPSAVREAAADGAAEAAAHWEVLFPDRHPAVVLGPDND